MVGLQPDNNPDLQDFLHWINDARCMGSGDAGDDAGLQLNRPFIPYREVLAYFKEPQRVRKLLEALYLDIEHNVDPNAIWKYYSNVFSILLLIGKGHFINHFVQYDSLCDHHLPFGNKPASFPIASTDPHFFTSFCNQQWEFCPPVFQYHMDKRFEPNEALPIIKKQKLAGGGSATTYKITLHPDYNQLSPNANSEQVKFMVHAIYLHLHPAKTKQDSNDQHANTFVLKTYGTKDAEKYYTNEVGAFRKIRHAGRDPSIIGFYGSFIQDGTYNIILEYADMGTLENYFERTTPPSRGEDIIKFWRRIFSILGALMMIHGMQYSNAEGPQIFQGWHQDVKPANILVKSNKRVSSYDCHFKLADLGLSHFRKKMSSDAEATDRDTQGTQTYGAPECYRFGPTEKSPFSVKQNVDIWSLGCVFSEAAIWVVRGWDGLLEYRRRRKMETAQTRNFKESDCFHDGEKALSIVHDMHRNLAEDRRASDHITTEPALYSMIKDMLEKPDGRPNAKYLSFKSGQIIAEAEEKLQKSTIERPPAHTVGSSQTKAAGRPQTPPELPPEFSLFQQTTPPPRHNTISSMPGNYPDSIKYPETEVRHANSNDSTPARRSSRRAHYPSHRPTQSDDSDIVGHDNYGQLNSHEDDNQFSDPRPNQFFLGQGHTSSRTYQQGTSNPIQGPGSHRIVTFPSANFRNDARSPPAASNGNAGALEQTSFVKRPISQQDPHNAPAPIPALAITPPAKLPHRESTPQLSVAAALQWKANKKQGGSGYLPYKRQLESLNQRDHVFLIDDAGSMLRHWKEVKELLGLLAYMVKDSDPDGIELYFTISSDKYKAKTSTKLSDKLEKKSPEGTSNIRWQMSKILREYQSKLRQERTSNYIWNKVRTPRPVRPQNLYIFTDGVWQPSCDPTDIIKELVDCLREHQFHKEQFGIQFIRFGNDAEGIERLEHLDSGLNLPLDIIDAEPSDGNVWKMLFGAINAWFDDDVNVTNTSNGVDSRPTNTVP